MQRIRKRIMKMINEVDNDTDDSDIRNDEEVKDRRDEKENLSKD